MRSPCHHGRECYKSINQSIDQTEGFKSFNQPINPYLLLFLLVELINQSINQQSTISKSVFSLNCRGLPVLIVFRTVLRDEKTNGTVRWGRGCGGGGGEPNLGTGYFVLQ